MLGLPLLRRLSRFWHLAPKILALLLLGAQAVHSSESSKLPVVEVALTLAIPAAEQVQARLLVWAENGEPPAAPAALEVKAPWRGEIPFTPPARLALESPSHWAKEVTLTTDLPVVEMILWPVAEVRGAFALDSEVPGQLSLGFEPVRLHAKTQPRQEPKGRVPCRIDGRAFSCAVPAAALDLKLEAEGFVPFYLWNRQLPPGGKLDLRTLRLEKGASVAGWVELPPRVAPAAIEVSLDIAATGFHGDPVLGTQLARKRRDAKIDERGFFQIKGVEPGGWTIVARTPGRPNGPSFSLQIRRDEEQVLSVPLSLPEPGRLRIFVEPSARSWQVSILARQARSQLETTVQESRTADTGWLELDELPVGIFGYRISDEIGGIWKSGELEIVSGENPPLLIEIPQIEVAGKVLLGKEPVAAKITFGAMGDQQVPIHSGEDGSFEGFLPRTGQWELSAEVEGGGYARLAPVKVSADGTRLLLRIPAASVEGKVYEDGQPKADALVMIKGDGGRGGRILGTSVTDAEGHFRTTGLDGGRLGVRAKTEDRQSDWVEIEIEDGENLEEIRLDLLASSRLRGRVSAQGVPLPGAQIAAIPEPSHLGRTFTSSGVDGRFEVQLPAGAASATLVILAQGYTAAFERVSPGGGSDLTFNLASGAGSLGLRGLFCEPGSHSVVHGTVRLDLFDIFVTFLSAERAAGGADGIALNGLPPGHYQICENLKGRCLETEVRVDGLASLDFGSKQPTTLR